MSPHTPRFASSLLPAGGREYLRCNVNVSMLGGVPVGPGGFIDIARNARKLVFCGSFTTKGLRTGDGGMAIDSEGVVRKLVRAVDRVTCSGPQAVRRGQTVLA